MFSKGDSEKNGVQSFWICLRADRRSQIQLCSKNNKAIEIIEIGIDLKILDQL